MSIRAKSRRRLVALLVAVTVVAGLLASGMYVLRLRRDNLNHQNRQAGIDAAENGQYTRALNLLGPYLLHVNSSDPLVLYHYAVARRHLPNSDGTYLVDAANALQRAFQIDPTNRQVQQELLDLFTLAGGSTEALTTADDVLRREPDNVLAMYVRAFALHQLRRWDQAKAAAEAVIARDPAHFEAHRLRLDVARQQAMPDEQLRDLAESTQRENAGDPRFTLLLAMVYGTVGDTPAARSQLETLSGWTPPSPRLTQLLVGQWRACRGFPEALDVLRRADDRLHDLLIRQELVRRLWETGAFDEAIQRTADLDLADLDVDSYLLAYRALAFLGKGDRHAAAAIADTLSTRRKAPLARAWATVLSLELENPGPTELIAACRTALELDTENPIAHFLIGQAYADLGELELAINAWNTCRAAAPLWPKPYLRLIYALLCAGHSANALQMAGLLHQLTPHDINAAMAAMQAWTAALIDGNTHDAENILVQLETLRHQLPQDETLITLHARVLAYLGRRQQAQDVIRQALATTPLTPAGFASLMDVSDQYDLGLRGQFLQAASTQPATAPDVALQRALELHRQGQPQQALAALTPPADQPPTSIAWAVVRARFAQEIGDPQAPTLWASLIDDHPDSLAALQAVLDTQAAWADLPLIEHAIQRLRNLTGDSGLSWKLAHARWLLARNTQPTDVADAIQLLEQIIATTPNMIPARLLLAAAHERTGDAASAAEDLSVALTQRPNLTEARLDLARLLITLGQYSRAALEIESVASRRDLLPAALRQTSALLARLGNLSGAARLLESYLPDHADDHQARLLLAGVYRRQNQTDATSTLCAQLLQQPSAAAIEFAADFYASIGQLGQAQQALARLAELDLSPDAQQLILANYALRYQSIDAAMDHLRSAVASSPSNAQAWQALVTLAVRDGRVDQAAQAIVEAAEKCPPPQGAPFQLLTQHLDLLRQFGQDQTLRPLVSALIEDSTRRSEAIEALRSIAAAQQQRESNQAVNNLLRQLADRYPRFLALQNALVSRYLLDHQPQPAAEIATRTMHAFPDAIEPAWLAAQALAASGRWSEALSVAEEWRQRSVNRPLEADLMIAEAHLRLGQADQAVDQIQPHLRQALLNPDANAQVLVSQARALVAAGREDQAAQLLRPLLPKGAQWREAWINLAVLAMTSPSLGEAWLQEVEPLVPQDAIEERVALARGWYSLGARTDTATYRLTGQQMLESLIQRPDCGPTPIVNLALLRDMDDDLPAAERLYRQALSQDPHLSAALNNLAVVLARQGGPQQLQEAARLAQQAIEAAPDIGAFYDTLAFVQIRLGQLHDAAASLRTAGRLEPWNLQWQARLAGVLRDLGQLQEAQSIAATVQRLDPQLRDLSDDDRRVVQAITDAAPATQPTSPL